MTQWGRNGKPPSKPGFVNTIAPYVWVAAIVLGLLYWVLTLARAC